MDMNVCTFQEGTIYCSCTINRIIVLVKPDATVLSVFGAGMQAKAHIDCVLALRPSITTLYIVNRTLSRATTLKKYVLRHTNLTTVHVLEQATYDFFHNADVICTTTNSSIPLFEQHPYRYQCHWFLVRTLHGAPVSPRAANMSASGIRKLSGKETVVLECITLFKSVGVHRSKISLRRRWWWQVARAKKMELQ